MNCTIVFKEQFSVIGKMGQGLSSEAPEWIPPLWQQANADFSVIAPLIKRDKEGGIFGLWGLMSDADETFERWGEYGKYLAGCEAESFIQPPEGFVKWTIPAQTYIVALCSSANYGEIFSNLVNCYIPENHLTIVGAIHEHYPEPGNPDRIELYVPIRKEGQ